MLPVSAFHSQISSANKEHKNDSPSGEYLQYGADKLEKGAAPLPKLVLLEPAGGVAMVKLPTVAPVFRRGTAKL